MFLYNPSYIALLLSIQTQKWKVDLQHLWYCGAPRWYTTGPTAAQHTRCNATKANNADYYRYIEYIIYKPIGSGKTRNLGEEKPYKILYTDFPSKNK